MVREFEKIKMLESFWIREYRDDRRGQHPYMLIHNAFAGPMAPFLQMIGIKAWELTPLWPIHKWTVQGMLEASPIRRESIHIVWSNEKVINALHLHELKQMVAPMGFLIIDLGEDWMYGNMQNGWQRFPFEFNGYTIYRKMPSYSA